MTKELDVTASAVPGAWRLTICQNTSGYRFALDAFLLADFVPTTVTGPLIDLGTGCGVVALFLARRFPQASIIGLELQSSLAAVAQHNVVRNGLTPQVSIVQGDIRQAQALFPARRLAPWYVTRRIGLSAVGVSIRSQRKPSPATNSP